MVLWALKHVFRLIDKKLQFYSKNLLLLAYDWYWSDRIWLSLSNFRVGYWIKMLKDNSRYLHKIGCKSGRLVSLPWQNNGYWTLKKVIQKWYWYQITTNFNNLLEHSILEQANSKCPNQTALCLQIVPGPILVRQNVGFDLDPNFLTWYSWKNFVKKFILKKKINSMQNFPACKDF